MTNKNETMKTITTNSTPTSIYPFLFSGMFRGSSVVSQTHINDASAVANFTRNYEYDKGNNLVQIKQLGSNSFTRDITISSKFKP